MSNKALEMIHAALWSMMKKGKNISRLRLMVCPESKMSETTHIRTKYGLLKVSAENTHVTKGTSYIIEELNGKPGFGFAWVSRRSGGVDSHESSKTD